MVHKGPDFYDDPEIFAEYWGRRERAVSANALLETPVCTELVGDVRGLRVLDLGCGDAQYGRELLSMGAERFVGVDGSANMVAKARETLKGTQGEVVHADLETWQGEAGAFDLVVSRLVLHYLPDLPQLLARVREWLVPGGRLVFSVEHPVVLSCNASLEASGRRGSWIVDDYFVSGRRDVQWLGGSVVKYHRTLEQYFLGMQAAGFQVEMMRESAPKRELFESEEEFVRRSRIPLFLFIAGRSVCKVI